MVGGSKYWQLVRLDSTGRRRIQEIPVAKAFFTEQFADQLQQVDLPDAAIQQKLMQMWQEQSVEAEYCLRCYLSNQIVQVCLQLETQFGKQHGFTCNELLAFVLDDVGRNERARPSSTDLNTETIAAPSFPNPKSKIQNPKWRNYPTFSTTVLQSFDPNRASLNTWVTQLVRRHPELNAFLLQQGVYLISDWAILNDTTPTQLQRIYLEFHSLTRAETDKAMAILQSYHRVYRQDRLNQRQTTRSRQCLPPSPEQLQRMSEWLQQNVTVSAERLLSQLQTIATLLRQYRIYVKGGKLPIASLDRPEIGAVVADREAPEPDETLEAKNEFLDFYRQQLLTCLDETLKQVIQERVTTLRRKKPPTDQVFLTALHLFHCQGKAMGDMAAQLGFQAQYQVSRLLKLKELRADVRQRSLQLLSQRVLEKAKKYADPEQLSQLEQQVGAVLEEQIDAVIQQAEAEAVVAKNCPLTSPFARRLCQHLDTLELELGTKL
jgi:hypothetical protein